MGVNRPLERGRAVDILLVEPNPDDAKLLAEAIEGGAVSSTIHVVCDGDEALDLVYQRGDHTESPRPDLVLLNPKLPGASGEDVLSEFKGRSELRHIPVLVLASSDVDEDVTRAYELHANAYIQKPVGPKEFTHLARSLEDFWLETVHLPLEAG